MPGVGGKRTFQFGQKWDEVHIGEYQVVTGPVILSTEWCDILQNN